MKLKIINVTLTTTVWGKESIVANSYKRRLRAFKFFLPSVKVTEVQRTDACSNLVLEFEKYIINMLSRVEKENNNDKIQKLNRLRKNIIYMTVIVSAWIPQSV
jgi:hypothetical protein